MARRPTCVSRLRLLRDDVARHGLSVRSRREDDLIGCSKTAISYALGDSRTSLTLLVVAGEPAPPRAATRPRPSRSQRLRQPRPIPRTMRIDQSKQLGVLFGPPVLLGDVLRIVQRRNRSTDLDGRGGSGVHDRSMFSGRFGCSEESGQVGQRRETARGRDRDVEAAIVRVQLSVRASSRRVDVDVACDVEQSVN